MAGRNFSSVVRCAGPQTTAFAFPNPERPGAVSWDDLTERMTDQPGLTRHAIHRFAGLAEEFFAALLARFGVVDHHDDQIVLGFTTLVI